MSHLFLLKTETPFYPFVREAAKRLRYARGMMHEGDGLEGLEIVTRQLSTPEQVRDEIVSEIDADIPLTVLTVDDYQIGGFDA